jgi:putative methionine-R-sulfoxide reductase with GAF domain
VENGIVSEEKQKPVFDEPTLAKLLEAAYVLQEHNREVRELELGLDLKRDQIEAEEKENKQFSAPAPIANPRESEQAGQADYTFTLAQIVATQHQIQIRHLELDKAMALVTERVIEIANASGAAIGMVDGKKIRYRAVAGSKTLPLGTEVPVEKALCLPCIRNAQAFRCVDVDPEFLIDTQECRRRGIQSLIAVPIFHEGGVAGGLELYYPNQNGFTEQDIHTCQLMAGLVTEALARDEETHWKQSLADEREVMRQALEKLKPSLSAIVETEPRKKQPARAVAADSAIVSYPCAKCGHKLVGGEQFCGQCGTPRSGDVNIGRSAPPAEEFSETAAAARASVRIVPDEKNPLSAPSLTEETLADSLEEEFPDLFSAKPVSEKASLEKPDENIHAVESATSLAKQLEGDPVAHDLERSPEPAEESAPVLQEAEDEQAAHATPATPADWSSAASAREFLEQVAATKPRGALERFWDARRGDIYLAIAVILVACVIRWGIWSNHQVSATSTPPAVAASGHKKPAAPDADLSLFDRMLISLGMAEPPETPEDKGNPTVQVWIDLKTALYYCPGADRYGKTPKGRYASQRDAQLDQYEPAYRKACE